MFDAVEANFDQSDIVIMSAAVADYRPAEVASEKIKKQNEVLEIRLSKTRDILGTMGSRKKQQYSGLENDRMGSRKSKQRIHSTLYLH